MNRRKFLSIAGITIAVAGTGTYLLSDKNNFERSDIKNDSSDTFSFQPDEKEILYLASLAPSGHNIQPWFIKYIEPYHWIIGNKKSKWLPAVDPAQRETILSIGAFIQNLEYAANYAGYSCKFDLLASTNQYSIDLSLDTIKEQLNPCDFFRINRQYLVKLSAIKNVHVFPKSRLKLELDPPVSDEIFVAQEKVPEFKKWIDGV